MNIKHFIVALMLIAQPFLWLWVYISLADKAKAGVWHEGLIAACLAAGVLSVILLIALLSEIPVYGQYYEEEEIELSNEENTTN